MRTYGIALILLALAAVFSWYACTDGHAAERFPDKVSYNFDIRPIFSDKCFKCHGPDAGKRQAHLRLDIADSAFAALTETKGAFAIIPGNPDASELYKRVSSDDTSFVMPPPDAHVGSLTEREVELIKRWIKQGATFETHWAFSAPRKAALPVVKDKQWVKNEIDYFTLEKMEEAGLQPNAEADKERLLKRAALDITGLPPTIQQMDQFLADDSPAAYEQMISQLMQSPQYGEKMAVHWLDVARYADSYGYQDDNVRTQWPWRDWVIHAFNQNMPYDQFLTWQIAGDMLPGANAEQKLATAFFRNHKYTEEGGVIPEEYRMEYLEDKTKTFGKGILGVTIECAQCHDHKYDPFSQRDYYSLLAFFNNTKEKGYEGDVSISKPAKNPMIRITDEERQTMLSYIRKNDTVALTVSVMADDTARQTYILRRGVYDQPGDSVVAAAPRSILKYDTTLFPRNRIGLARWTTSRQNPLTARVFVNQTWQEIFGRGLVKTAGDFGMQGELPSHPALLDWLAADFMEHGWDIKRLVKQILLSATYRQSVKADEEKIRKDPENKWLSRGPRSRLAAEFVRDLVLSSSGLLNPAIGGPSVKPYQPKGLWESATSGRGQLATYKQDKDSNLYRRGMYTFIKLTVPPPSMILFDASNRDQCEVRRLKTNTPLQALMMMNDPTVLEASRVLAQQLLAGKGTDEENIRLAFRRIICRKASVKEEAILVSYFKDQWQQFRDHLLDASLTLKAGEYPLDKKADKTKLAALMKTINTIYNMEEAITKT